MSDNRKYTKEGYTRAVDSTFKAMPPIEWSVRAESSSTSTASADALNREYNDLASEAIVERILSGKSDRTTGDGCKLPDADGYWVYIELENHKPIASKLLKVVDQRYTWLPAADSVMRLLDELEPAGVYIFIF